MSGQRIIVVGGSVCGMAASLALARDGQRVVVLEQDTAPMPEDAEGAFAWQRRGCPQFGHSHAFLGRMYCEIRDREPELLRKLLAQGAERLGFERQARQYFDDPVFEPGDEDIALLACRRSTFEWVLRQHLLDTGLIEFRDAVLVTGLLSERDAATRLARVTGVRTRDEEIRADLVVDASGRRTKLSDWLQAIGAPAVRQESQDCGIFYSSRFYRLCPGVAPPNQDGIIGGDLGYLKFGIFPADGGTFSVTQAAAPDDEPLRAVLRTPGFETAARALPMLWEWIQPGVSEPISEAHGMANLRNTRRYLVEDGEPIALGMVAVGDALIHANPITGRGCTLAWVASQLLADAVSKHAGDARALALELHAGIERHAVPWIEAQLRQDADALEVNAAQRRNEDPYQVERPDGTNDPKAYMRTLLRDGLMPATRENLQVMRTMMRMAHMLDTPSSLLERPEIIQAALAAYERRHERPPRVTGPSRTEMLELLAAA